jgi:hypothetical protein
MTYTLTLDVMQAAARFDQFRSDLIAGALNYGLRPERRIDDEQLLRQFGYPAGEDLWIPPPKGHDSWTVVIRTAIKSDPTYRLT